MTPDLHNIHPAVIITAGCTGDVMQELISQIAALGIEITPTTSLIIIFGIILLTAIVVHFILHKGVLRAFEKRAGQQPFVAANHHPEQTVSPAGLYPARDYRQCAGGAVAAKRQ
jgi:hypothetical protein